MTAVAIAAFSLGFALVAVALLVAAVYAAVLFMERRDARTARLHAARDARIADAARSWAPAFAGLDDRAAVLAALEARP